MSVGGHVYTESPFYGCLQDSDVSTLFFQNSAATAYFFIYIPSEIASRRFHDHKETRTPGLSHLIE